MARGNCHGAALAVPLAAANDRCPADGDPRGMISSTRVMNIVRSGPVHEPHRDFTTGAPCVVPPACDAQGARTGRPCTNAAVRWQDVENPNLLLHAHVCQEHMALRGTSADTRSDESHSVLYRTIVVTKVLGVW